MATNEETTTTRTTLTIRLTPAELDRIRSVAGHHGLTASSLLRMLVTKEARRVGIEPKAGAQ